MQQSFINHARFRYLWLSLILAAAAIAAYYWHQPFPRPNGGTWLGYTLGILSALIILMLLYLGIRKRRYHSSMGSLRGWVSAHVWLGLGLLILATLHSGFQLAWNIHGLSYYLLLAVIASGIWGMVMYLRNPAAMTRNRLDQSREMMSEQLASLDLEALAQSDRIGAELHHRLTQALAPAKPAGFWRRFSNRHWSATVRADMNADRRNNSYRIEQEVAALMAASKDSDEVSHLQDLLDLLSQRRQLSSKLGRDYQLQAQMELWLLLHVPLSLGLLAALISHVIAVFFYW